MTRIGIIAGAVAAVVVAGVATAVVWPDGGGDDDAAPAATTVVTVVDTVESTVVESTAPPSTEPEVGGVVAVPEASTLVASFASDVPRYVRPEGEPSGEVAAEWHGRPSILPVIDQTPGWVQVRLAQRPNGSTAWVRRSDALLAMTPYRVEIDVATTRLRVFKDGEEILDAPVGLGTEDAPTTVGNFFVAFKQEPPDTTSGWGPFVLVTSSHSETISDFESSGDAIAAIHGPLGADDEIGDTGAYVSHGCIRLHLDDLETLRDLPAGTPIDVIDSGDDAPGSSSPDTTDTTETTPTTETAPTPETAGD